jgi:indolepyruvate ferredoxin oxidoreductase alpha subunit
VVVLEELDPFFEEQIRALGIDVVGKDVFPLVGEFTVSIVRERAIAAGLVPPAKVPPVPADTKLQIADLPARPPALCPGCPHRSTFYLLRKLKLRVAGDIGCYTIGVLPPFDSIDTTGCMGASIGVAHGIDKAGATEKFVAVLGDSTLFHAGLPPLVNAVYNRGATTMLILDNATTGMTGQQDNPGTGKTLQGETAPVIDIERLVWAMGVEDVWVADAFDIVELEKIVKQAIAVRDRPSVVVVRGKCVFVDRRPRSADGVDFERCNGCSLCFRLGCPAISKGEVDARTGKPKAVIDELLCVGCDMCLDLCPREAIYSRG